MCVSAAILVPRQTGNKVSGWANVCLGLGWQETAGYLEGDHTALHLVH